MSIEAGVEDFEVRFGGIFLGALTEILGQTQTEKLMRQSSFPDFDSDLQFSWDSLNRILLIMKQSYPQHSAQGISQRVGEASFSPALQAFGPALGLTKSSFQLLPLRRKLPEAVEAIAALINQLSSRETSILQDKQYVHLMIAACALEYEQTDSLAHYFTGLIRAALYWISGGKSFHLLAKETFTISEDNCQLHIPLKPAA